MIEKIQTGEPLEKSPADVGRDADPKILALVERITQLLPDERDIFAISELLRVSGDPRILEALRGIGIGDSPEEVKGHLERAFAVMQKVSEAIATEKFTREGE